MSEPKIAPEISASIEKKVEEVHKAYEARLEKDRAFTRSVFAKLSWGVVAASAMLTYFGVKGLEDIIDRALKTHTEANLQNVRDHALVNSLVLQKERSSSGSIVVDASAGRRTYSDTEVEAIIRILRNKETRDQTYSDAVALLRTREKLPDVSTVLDNIAAIVRADKEDTWIHQHPRRHAALIRHLSEHRYSGAYDAIKSLLNSQHRDVQLAAIQYMRDCKIEMAVDPLAQLANKSSGDIRFSASLALLHLDPNHPEARKWLQDRLTDANGSLLETAKIFRQLSSVIESTAMQERAEASSRRQITPQGPRRRVAARVDPTLDAAAKLLDGALRAGISITAARSYGDSSPTHVLYMSEDDDTFIFTEDVVLSADLHAALNEIVNIILKGELRTVGTTGNLATFGKLIAGLSGIVTARDIADLGQDITLTLGTSTPGSRRRNGNIEFEDGEMAIVQNDSQVKMSPAEFRMRTNWRLWLDEDEGLMAQPATTSRSPSPSPPRKVKRIILTDEARFNIRIRSDDTGAADFRLSSILN